MTHSRAPNRWLTPTTIVATIVFLFLCVTAAFVVYIKTDYGQMILEIHDEQVFAELDEDHLTLIDKTSGRRYAIQVKHFFKVDGGHREHNEPWETGTYAIDSDKLRLTIVDDNGAEYETDEFTLRRSGKVRVRVSFQQSAPYALEFDDGAIVTSPRISLEQGQPFTLEAYVRPLTPGHAPFLHVTGQASLQYILKERIPRAVWGFHVRNNPTNYSRESDDNLPYEGKFVHLAGVYDSKTIQLFINGRRVDAPLMSESNAKAKKKRVEEDAAKIGDPVEGLKIAPTLGSFVVDEVRISTVARYQQDFKPTERFEADEHTLALYHFDEGQGDTLLDSSGNNHHGKIVGAKWVKSASSPKSSVRPTAEGCWQPGVNGA